MTPAGPDTAAPIFFDIIGDVVKIYIDYISGLVYDPCILAREGRFLETILKTEQGVASRGDRFVTASRGFGATAGQAPWRGGARAADPDRSGAANARALG